MTMPLRHSPIRSCESDEREAKGRRFPSIPYPHEVVLRHGVRYPAHFVVGLEDVVVDLELLSTVVPGKQGQDGSGWQSIQLSAGIYPAWIDK